MIIDLSERVETANSLTNAWATATGYKTPEVVTEDGLSKVARDLQRIMNASSFGCQQRNVHAILQALIGEKFPICNTREYGGSLIDYQRRAPFVIGSVLVPTTEGRERPGQVARVAKSGNAGLRFSNGEVGQHFGQHDLRPATGEEIERYFEELFGLEVHPDDNPPAEEQEPFAPEAELAMPF